MSDRLSRLYFVLDKAALDPAFWPDACDAIAALFGATGTLILPKPAEERSLIMPHSANLGEVVQRYMSEGWYRDDLRAQGFPRAFETGFVTDHHLISAEEMRRHAYYNELLAPCDLKWFIGTTITAGDRTWGVAVQGSPRRGAFDKADAELLLKARGAIETAANRTAALGFKRIEVVEDVLQAAGKGTAILSRSGRMLVANETAERLLAGAGLVSRGYLKSRIHAAEGKLELLRGRMRAPGVGIPGGPVSLSGRDGVLSLDLMPMPRNFGAVFSGAFAFLTVQELAPPGRGDVGRLVEEWRLTRREAELANHLLAGRQLADASREMKLSIGTARQYLKSVFHKTGCSRQAELILKLSRRQSG